MTLHYPETDAAPTTFGAPPREDLDTYATGATVEPAYATTEETIVPVYARKQPRKTVGGVPKGALMAIPVVLALGVGAWALTAGDASRKAAEAPATTDTDSLTTSRLNVTQTPSPEVNTPAVTEAPAEAAAAPLRPAPPAARVTRSSSPAPAARRAPARRAATTAPEIHAAPLPNAGLTTVITEPSPAPAAIAPTPTLPVEPTPLESPPATTTPPGGQA